MRRGLLATRTELERLRDSIRRQPFDHIYDVLHRRCSLILETTPLTEAMWRKAYESGYWRAATSAVQTVQGRVCDLVVAHAIDPNTAYRDRAIEELKTLAAYSTWVDPSHRDELADLCTGEAAATMALGLDWLSEELSEADRIRCHRALREKAIMPYLKAVEAGAFWHSVYHNWNAVVNGGVGLAALLLSDEEASAATALNKARAGLKNFFAALGREGGWDEGLGYWGYAMRYLLMFGEALTRVADSKLIYHQRGMDSTGMFPVYFAPHGQAVSFGDWPVCPAWGVFYLLVKHYGLKEVAWWLDRYAFRQDASASGYSDAGLALLFRPTDWEPNPAPDLQPVKAFNEIGWVAVADCWPAPRLYAAVKTGDLSAYHSHLDMNCVQAMVDGELLLHDPGNPAFSNEYLSTEGRYRFYQVQSRAHNTVSIAGREHRIDANGSIVEAQDTHQFRWVAGDAGTALGEDVHFVRHLVLPLDGGGIGSMLIVLDEIRNAEPEPVHLTWHTAGAFALTGNASTGTIKGQSASLHFAVASNAPLKTSLSQQPLGTRVIDSVLTVQTPAVRDTILLSVFSRHPVGKLKLRRTSRGDLDMQIGTLRAHWKASRTYLRLQELTE